MNAEQRTLVQRLKEAGLGTRRFLKVNDNKAAFENDWNEHLYTPEELEKQTWFKYSGWGICGKDGLVFVEADQVSMAEKLREILPQTFEVKSPRRGLPHFYLKIEGGEVENKVLHLPGEEEGAGEIRAQNYYVVAAGTTISFRDLRTSEPRTGCYVIAENRPIAIMQYSDFMKVIEPYLGSNSSQKINFEQMRKGVPKGMRHPTGIRYATFLVGVQQFDYATAFQEMCRWNQLCKPPIDEADLERMVKSALEYVKVNPRAEEKKGKKAQQEDKSKKAKKTVLKDSGFITDGCFESIYEGDKPAFLVRNGGSFHTVEAIETEEETYSPKDVRHMPYEPYGFFKGEAPNREELFSQVYKVISEYVDVEPLWKSVLAACVLMSYHQEKIQTVPYVLVYGDNESGKSTVLQILKQLCYRPMYGVTIPAADLYGYLEDTDGIGCILEDEIQGIHKDTDKIKIYKAGYKQGAVVPRTIITSNDRVIKYYNTFCFKVCASEQLPHVKGFNERFLFIPMVEGFPEKEWTDVTKEELKKLSSLRNSLLKWRMENRNWELPELQLSIRGRLKELWKPVLQVVHGLDVYKSLFDSVEEQRKERLDAKQNTLEGQVVKAVYDICVESQKEPKNIPFSDIWEKLVANLDGKVDAEKSYVMHTSEFFDLTKNKIGYRLREVLSGKSKTNRDPEKGVIKAYTFDFEKLRRVSKKYNFDVTKLPTLPSCESMQGLVVAEKTEKTMENNVEKDDKSPDKSANAVQQLSNVSNMVTNSILEEFAAKTKSLNRLTTDFGIETCVLCKVKGRPDYQVNLFDGSWGLLCGPCGIRLIERLNKNE
jgi:hypothetical protein